MSIRHDRSVIEARACKTDIDWSRKPAPWCWIGPQVHADCVILAKGGLPHPKPFDRTDRQNSGSILRERRAALGLNQSIVADEAGYSTSAVSLAERGIGSRIVFHTIFKALTQLEATHK